MLPRWLAALILGLTTLVWFGNFVAQFVVPGYHSDPLLQGIYFSFVGGALALSRGKDEEKGDGKHGPSDPGGVPPVPPLAPPAQPPGRHARNDPP